MRFSCHIAPSTFATVALLAGLLFAGCGPGDVEQYNHPARITSLGPVEFQENSLLIDYTLFDREGDDQALQVGVCTKNVDRGVDCPIPVGGVGGDGRDRLPTVPEGSDVPHRLSWNLGCGLVDGNSCVETDLDQSYVVHMSLEGRDRTVSSAPFTLSEEFGLEELPSCDRSAGRIPEPCSPDTDE